MFQLTEKEFENLKSHFGISSWGGRRKRPYVFTENGIAMLSSVLNSERAIFVNIQIMRTFTKLRELLSSNAELARRMDALETKHEKHEEDLLIIFQAIKQLMEAPEEPQRQIGFVVDDSK